MPLERLLFRVRVSDRVDEPSLFHVKHAFADQYASDSVVPQVISVEKAAKKTLAAVAMSQGHPVQAILSLSAQLVTMRDGPTPAVAKQFRLRTST